MRKLIVLTFVSLDGVMQAPGGPEEDGEGGFKFGGWTHPYFDEEAGRLMAQQMQPADLLLGRKTFQIFRILLAGPLRRMAGHQRDNQVCRL